MAGAYGRDVTFTWGGAALDGVREKSFTIDGEAVNVTSDEDGGVRVLLDRDAEAAINYEISGVDKDAVLRRAKGLGNIQEAVSITFSNGDTVSFTANLAAYTEGQPFGDAITFSATLMSTGPWVYTLGDS